MRGVQKGRSPIGVKRCCRNIGVEIVESARIKIVFEEMVGFRSCEKRVPAAKHIMVKSWFCDLSRLDRPTEPAIFLQDTDMPSSPGD